jgi:hypothetical protein
MVLDFRKKHSEGSQASPALLEWYWQGNTYVLLEKPVPSATLSTINLTRTGVGSNPGLDGVTPASNRQSHGTAFHLTEIQLIMDIDLVRTAQ